MNKISIVVDSLRYAYPDGARAIEDVSFSIEAGECVGLIGPNGAGKSTLLMLLVGLIVPDGGEMRLGGKIIERRSLSWARRHLGYVFQDPDDQLFMTTVEKDVSFGPRNMGLTEAEIAERSSRALETVGIAHLGDRPPFRLSGGEKRAAAIASVLSMEPQALVLDEPTASLDPRARRQVMGLLHALPQTRLIATHDMDLVYELCDRVIVLSGGHIAADGPSAAILGDERQMTEAGLELPLCLRACPRCGSKKHPVSREGK
jgi:cobalt/nickel transport system ATP-binding protein